MKSFRRLRCNHFRPKTSASARSWSWAAADDADDNVDAGADTVTDGGDYFDVDVVVDIAAGCPDAEFIRWSLRAFAVKGVGYIL